MRYLFRFFENFDEQCIHKLTYDEPVSPPTVNQMLIFDTIDLEEPLPYDFYIVKAIPIMCMNSNTVFYDVLVEGGNFGEICKQ